MSQYYEIKVLSKLDKRWSTSFPELTLSHTQENQTLLSGFLPDQTASHGIFKRIRDLNLTLLSVNVQRSQLHSQFNENER